MKVKLLSIVILIIVGIVVAVSVVSAYVSKENEYSSYIASARLNAKKEIPYNAYNYYMKAFSIHNDSEDIYVEFLEQAKLLGEGFYSSAINNYIVYFPMSQDAYSLICEREYENGNFKNVLKYALEAREKGIATDRMRELYQICAYKYIPVCGGYDQVQSYVGDFANVKIADKYGIINKKGKYLIAPMYEQLSTFVNGAASAYDGERWFVVNSGGYVVARPDKDIEYLSVLSGGKMVVCKNGKYGYTDTSLVIPEDLPYDFATIFRSNIAATKKDGKWSLVNINYEEMSGYIFDDIILDEYGACVSNDIIFAKKGDYYYMYNTSGEQISEQGFDNARPFLTDSIAAVSVEGKWGFVDKEGKMVIEPKYSDARSFSSGLAPVCINGKWGFINSSEETKIEFIFDDCLSFDSAGVAAVKEKETWRYIKLLMYDF